MSNKHTKKHLHVDVNFSGLLKNFGEVFSGEKIWIRELLQNARRAGASKIKLTTDPSDLHYLQISDDGCGIPDFQTLLTLGDSGWEQETIEKENPFGLGCYATLYAATEVEIRSNRQHLTIETEKLLKGEPVQSEPDQTRTGTTIIIRLKEALITSNDSEKDGVRVLIEKIICGFPVPVFLNGIELQRPYALDVWQGLRFDLSGGVALVELDPKPPIAYKEGKTFLQGFNISEQASRVYPWPNFDRTGMRVHMHLHPDQWRVRVPDRNTLYNSKETSKKIEVLQSNLRNAAVVHIVSQGEGAKHFDTLLAWHCYEPIRSIPIPGDRWHCLNDPPYLLHYEDEEIDDSFNHLNEQEAPTPENGIRFIRDWDEIYFDEKTINHLFAAYLFKIPVLRSWNDPEHWFSKTSSGESFDVFFRRRVSVSVKKEDHLAEGSWWGKKVILCKRFYLDLEGHGTKEVMEDVFLDDTFWIIDQPLYHNYPIDQVFYFRTDGGDFDESYYENVMESFRASLAFLKGDLCELIASAILNYTEALNGHRFSVSAENGKIDVSRVS